MDTILNLGLNDKTVEALKKKTLNGRFAKDSYRRFIQMYSNVVMGVESHHFEELIENYKLTKGVLLDTELDENDWKVIGIGREIELVTETNEEGMITKYVSVSLKEGSFNIDGSLNFGRIIQGA